MQGEQLDVEEAGECNGTKTNESNDLAYIAMK